MLIHNSWEREPKCSFLDFFALNSCGQGECTVASVPAIWVDDSHREKCLWTGYSFLPKTYNYLIFYMFSLFMVLPAMMTLPTVRTYHTCLLIWLKERKKG